MKVVYKKLTKQERIEALGKIFVENHWKRVQKKKERETLTRANNKTKNSSGQ